MATKSDVVEMLKEDMRDEHGALILYPRHAYFLGESGEACQIEQTARDEMRHFKWLGQALVQLGGEPTLVRTEMDVGGDAPVQWMDRDVRAELDAIAKYGRHLAGIDDDKIKAMIERILTDERAHLAVFAGFRGEFAVATGPLPGLPTDGGASPDRIAEVLDYGTRHEYTVVLQYLLHSFMTSDYEASRELETVAVNEMQHMGWLGEYAAETGHAPLFEVHPVVESPETAAMLAADVDAEKAVFASYGKYIAELGGQPTFAELADILRRAQDNEGWHIHMFSMMLSRVQAGQHPWQRPGLARTQPPELGGREAVSQQPAQADQVASGSRLTVGSLIK